MLKHLLKGVLDCERSKNQTIFKDFSSVNTAYNDINLFRFYKATLILYQKN